MVNFYLHESDMASQTRTGKHASWRFNRIL